MKSREELKKCTKKELLNYLDILRIVSRQKTNLIKYLQKQSENKMSKPTFKEFKGLSNQIPRTQSKLVDMHQACLLGYALVERDYKVELEELEYKIKSISDAWIRQ